MTTVTKLMTADELFQMPEPGNGVRFELVEGELIKMAPAGGRHGACCASVTSVLTRFVKTEKLGRIMSNDTGVFTHRDPDTVLAPDIAFWSHARLPEMPEGFVEVTPELVVEVISPSDAQAHVHQKVLEYLDHGVRLIWVIDPKTHTVTVYQSRKDVRILDASEEISGHDVLPGFACRVGEFFE